jgi:hypothetical protein
MNECAESKETVSDSLFCDQPRKEDDGAGPCFILVAPIIKATGDFIEKQQRRRRRKKWMRRCLIRNAMIKEAALAAGRSPPPLPLYGPLKRATFRQLREGTQAAKQGRTVPTTNMESSDDLCYGHMAIVTATAALI